MRDVQFSNDGTKVYGTSDSKKIVVEIPFDKLRIDRPHGAAETSQDLVTIDNQISFASSSTLAALSSGPCPQIQQSNSLAFARDDQGQPVATYLRQSHEHGALVLRTLRGEMITQETLTRLPSWVDRESDATLLSRQAGNDLGGGAQSDAPSVRVVLNRATEPFKRYKSNDPPFVPALLERDQSTIPTVTGFGLHQLLDGDGPSQWNRSLKDRMM